MRAISSSKLAITALCMAFLAGKASAGSTAEATSINMTGKDTNQPPISVEFKVQGGPGQIPATRAYITAGTNKFAFLVPDEFKLASSEPQKVTLMKRDGSCLFTVRVVGPTPGNGKAFDANAARVLLNEMHPEATINSEFGMYAAGVGGPAFEIQWGWGALARASRVGFVPLRGGLLEFALDARPENLGASLGDFNFMMVTFRESDENGKLEATPLSDRI